MREIKFRAMTRPPEDFGGRHFTSEMVYGTGFLKDPVNTWLVSSNEKEALAFGTTKKIVKPETVGQFTGLNDKNGKEIYEGDIAYSQSRCFTVIIKYGEAKYIGVGVTLAGIIVQYIGGHKKEEPFMIYSGKNDWEIIGNIHENPELLEVTK